MTKAKKSFKQHGILQHLAAKVRERERKLYEKYFFQGCRWSQQLICLILDQK